MKDPRPINEMTTAEVESKGWAAEARDADGHLIATVAWLPDVSTNENYQMLGEFIREYETKGGYTVQVFQGNIK